MVDKIKYLLLVFILLLPDATVYGQTIPWSYRSRAVASRVELKLKKAFYMQGLSYTSPIYIRIFKQEKELEIWVKEQTGFKLFKKYPVCTYGNGSLGPKMKVGDKQAPEGFYFVTPHQMNPASKYHLSFNLGYPNEFDRWHNRTGSALMVHGDCVSIGCYAMTDAQIEEIYTIASSALRNGQVFFRVHIFPFRMSEKNMDKHLLGKTETLNWFYSLWLKLKNLFFKKEKKYNYITEHAAFWQNLKEGYDLFEANGNVPPNTVVKNGIYIFNQDD